MNFRIIDRFIQGKKSMKLCEDRIVVTDDYACVIDGATSKSSMDFNGKAQGKIAGIIIEDLFPDLTGYEDVYEFVITVNKRFENFYKKHGLYNHMKVNPVDRLNASVVIYSFQREELWMIGDCQAICGRNYYSNGKILDDIMSDLRSIIIQMELDNGKTESELLQNDTAREAILPYLKKMPMFQNRLIDSEYSYGVLDGFNINRFHVKSYQIRDRDIILASDGYPKLFNTLKESEDYLEQILKDDPLCFKKNKSTKGLQLGYNSFDDRAYLKLRI